MKTNSRLTGNVINPVFSDRRSWPVADSGKVCIFEAIELVGAARYGNEWSGEELSATWWNLGDDRDQEVRFARLRSPAPMNSGGGSALDIKRASQLGMSVENWQRRGEDIDAALALEEAAWRANRTVFHRLEAAIDWLVAKCRDGALRGYYRLRTGGALSTMGPSDWNAENPLATFVSEGGNKRWIGGHRPQLRTIYVFIERADLVAAIATFEHTPITASSVDLSKLSPYLQLAVKLALANNYTTPDSDETQDIRESEVRRVWEDAVPDVPASGAAVTAIAKVMGFPDPEAIRQGQSARAKKGYNP
jgi:hypothetical protein